MGLNDEGEREKKNEKEKGRKKRSRERERKKRKNIFLMRRRKSLIIKKIISYLLNFSYNTVSVACILSISGVKDSNIAI